MEDFQAALKRKLALQAMNGGVAGASPAPATTQSSPSERATRTYSTLSPEAAASMNQGTEEGTVPAPLDPAGNAAGAKKPNVTTFHPVSQDYAASLKSQGFGTQNVQTDADANARPGAFEPSTQVTKGTQQPAYTPPVPLEGKPFTEQASLLSAYLQKLGVASGPFVVGGTSSLDPKINSLINQINDPSTPESQRRFIAQELGVLMQQRADVVQGTTFTYDPVTGQATPTKKSADQLTGGLVPRDGNIPGVTTAVNPVTPPVNAELMNRLIELFARGGITDEQKTAQESQFVSDVERASQGRRQRTADSLAASGVFGGRGLDVLEDTARDTDATRASGLAQIRVGILDKQQQARSQALEAILRQVGIGANEAQGIAQILTNRAIAQAQIASGNEQGQNQLNAQLLNTRTNASTATRGQDMNFIMSLLSLNSQVSEADRALIQQLLTQYMSGGE